MNLHAAADAPIALQLAADALLVLHIGGGTVGMASGFAAMVFRKGGKLHRLAGNRP